MPHTLEHLIFLGSEQYPYKGVLDTLANRAFAQGTNAWTAQDHTAYTLTTAGSDGFLRMLPVYLDHVFHPTLTKEGFVTEVYHVNGKGEDAGVVFSEMQGRENGSGDLMQLAWQRKLYSPSSAYRSETGGLMSALRVLSVDEIRKYHHTYYEPYNTAVVVCGPLDRAKLFESLQPVEERLVQHGVKGAPSGWKRPFIDTASNAPPNVEGQRSALTVDFPEKDESMGEVMVSWVGPRVDEFIISEALSLLGTYLTDSAVSPIQNAFVERDDPLCTDVYFSLSDKAGATTVEAYFSSVPTEHLAELDTKLVDDVLGKVVQDGIDMDRMKMLIRRERVKLLNMLETKPADAFADVIINDFLYGKSNGADLEASLDEMRRFDILDQYTPQQWSALLDQWLVRNARVAVSGKPSAKMADRLKEETKALVEKRKKEFGEEGLKKLDEIVKDAQQINDREIPKDMLSQFEIPDVNSINFIAVGTAAEGAVTSVHQASKREGVATVDEADKKVQAHIGVDANPALPFYVHWSDVRSNFVTLTMMFDTSSLASHLRPLISILLGSIWSVPMKRADGTSLSYEDVVKGLDNDTLEYEAGLGFGSGFSELVSFEIKVERTKYEQGFAWLRDIIWHTELVLERIRVNASKLAQSLPEQRRDGRMLSLALGRSLTHSDQLSSNVNNTILKQSEIVPSLVERLASSEQAPVVLKELEELRQSLFRPENMIVSVAGDVLGLEKPHAPLQDLVKTFGWRAGKAEAPAVVNVPLSRQVLTSLGKTPARKCLVTPLPTIESSYAVFTARGIAGWHEADSAALSVTISVLNAMESYLWRYIRGAGLAYGASIRSDVEAQLIHFTLYRSPDAAKAFQAASDVIGKLVRGEMDMDETVVDSAKSSLCFGVADSEGTVGLAAGEAFSDGVLRGLQKGRGRRLLEDARRVTIDDVRACLRKYIQPLFDPATSVCAVVSSPARFDEIFDALAKLGYEAERREVKGADTDELDDDDEDMSDEGSSTSGSGANAEDPASKQKL